MRYPITDVAWISCPSSPGKIEYISPKGYWGPMRLEVITEI